MADPGCDGWRDRMKAKGESDRQAFSRRLMSQGYNGMLVRSFVKGAKPDDINIVLWNWGEALPSRLIPMDDDGRLSSPNS